MRKSILILWLVIVTSFTGILLYSTAAEIDAYHTVFNFEFQISDVTIIQNQTGNFQTLEVSASIFNPSALFSFRVNMIKGIVMLNEQGSEYLRGPQWLLKTISPGANSSVTWAYPILEQDLDLLNDANTTGTWRWYFSLKVNVDTIVLGNDEFDRSQSFQGVKMVTI